LSAAEPNKPTKQQIDASRKPSLDVTPLTLADRECYTSFQFRSAFHLREDISACSEPWQPSLVFRILLSHWRKKRFLFLWPWTL